MSGRLELNSVDITKSHVGAWIDAATINTRDSRRDDHLKGDDFFDVEEFPNLSFKSTHVFKKNDDQLAVEGQLTIHGVTRDVIFDVVGPSAPVNDPSGSTRIGLAAAALINRKDFGLSWNIALETVGFFVGEEVTIALDVECVKSVPKIADKPAESWWKRKSLFHRMTDSANTLERTVGNRTGGSDESYPTL